MLGHAIRNEVDDLAALIRAEGGKTLAGAVNLCTFAADYICIDVTGMRWPAEGNLRHIAHRASESATGYPSPRT